MVDILISIAAQVAGYTVAPIGRQLGYLFRYKTNVEDLNTKIVDLKNVKQRLQVEVDEAQSNGENIFDDVNDWLGKVDNTITEDHGNFTRHEEQANTKFTCGAKFPNLVLRHRLSRRAKKMAEKVATQIQDGNNFKQVSYRPPPPNSVENKGYDEFQSRNRTLTDVMEALRDPSVGMVGVWGMGGVGKTMLAKEVARRAKDEEKLFTKVVFTTVSKDQNIEKIQQEIGEKLGMHFHEQSKDVRAERLQNRLREENNILIIVDDIWDQLDLEDVGISLGIDQKGCKILFTTRYSHVLANDMGVDRNVIFAVGVLLEHEAVSLFRKIVGDQAEKHDDFQDLATQIVKECEGLPIAITTVASALKNKGCAVWKNALQELRKSNPINIQGMHEKVYTSIKFSYDDLKSVEAKHLLLLCSLFPEDANIDLRVLCNYGLGLNLFEDVNTLEEARNKTDALLTNLKDHSLLLDDDSYFGHDGVKMHDVIRDVVIFIASKLDDHHRMHNIRNADELDMYVNKEMFKDSTAISLYHIKADQYPQTLKTPELKLLRLVNSYGSGKLPHQFFERLNKLLVLDSVGVSIEPLPAASSFCLLPNLQTLRLTYCILGDISWIGELKNLKILDLSFSSITELPRGIGKLNRLISLNLEGCINLKVIEPNVILSLTRLEELNLKDSFTNWEVDDGVVNGYERRNANLNEVKNLPHLIDLNLQVPDINSVPKDIFSEQLKKYHIIIGYGESYHWHNENTSRRLKLKLCPDSELNEHDFKELLKTSDVLYLNGLKSVKSVAFEIDSMGFQRLKRLTVEESIEIRCIVNWNNGNMDYMPAAFPCLESLVLTRLMNLENIIHKKLTTETSFGKLREIEVSNCDKLKSLFPLFNIPRQLERIQVEDCKMMEEIISYHGGEGDHFEKIEISQLQNLVLGWLPKLVQFKATRTSDDEISEGQSIDDSVAPLFNEQVVFPKLDELFIRSLNIQNIWNKDQLPLSMFGFQSLTTISVWDCDYLKGLIPSFMSASFVHLRSLTVGRCKTMKEIVFIEESAQVVMSNYIVSFPKLEFLELVNLSNLERFYRGDCIDCSSLLRLEIEGCVKLRVFITNTMSITTTDIEEEKSTEGLVDKQHLSHFKDVVKVELSRISSCSEIIEIKGEGQSINDSVSPLFNGQVVFPKLDRLNIQSLSVRKIWNDDHFLSSRFQNLTNIVVSDCDHLKGVIPSFMTASLVHLQKLSVQNCKAMKEIVFIEESSQIVMPNYIVSFPKLEFLELYGLPNLEKFCGGDCVDCPSLSLLSIRGCLKLRVFKTNTMPTTTIEEENSMRGSVDKQHLSHRHKDVVKIELMSTESSCSEITCQHPPPPPHTLGSVEEHHHDLVFKTKRSLSVLKLWNFPYVQQLPKSSQTVEELSICEWGMRLKELATPLMCFQNLKVLMVKDCHGLTSLLSPSTAKSLSQQLTRLGISGCKSLRQVIANDDKEADADHTNIIFSQLKSLVLDDLSNLTSFYSGNNNNVVLQFPHLDKLIVDNCPEMKTFYHGNIHCPSLQRITLGESIRDEIRDIMWKPDYVDRIYTEDYSYWMGDINTSIEKLREDINIRDSPESEKTVDNSEEDSPESEE